MFFTKQWLEFEKHAHRWRGGHPRVPFKDRFTVLFFPKFTLELRTSNLKQLIFLDVRLYSKYKFVLFSSLRKTITLFTQIISVERRLNLKKKQHILVDY